MKLLHKTQMKKAIENDKSAKFIAETFPYNFFFFRREVLEGLQRVGFKINYGEDNSGFYMMILKRAGGFYLGANLFISSSMCM